MPTAKLPGDRPGDKTPPVKRVPQPGDADFDWDAFIASLSGGPKPSSVNVTSGPRTTIGSADPNTSVAWTYGVDRVKGFPLAESTGDVIQADFFLGIGKGEIQSGDRCFINGYDIGNNSFITVTYYRGLPGGETCAALNTLIPTGSVQLTGYAFAHVHVVTQGSQYTWQQSLPPSAQGGVISFEFEIHGRKIYDMRPGTQDPTDPTTWTYSNNAALCTRDAIMVAGGIDTTEIDDTNVGNGFHVAADKCDTGVIVDGSPVKFTVDWCIANPTQLKNVLDTMKLCCNGDLHYQSGLWRLWIDVVNASSPALTLDVNENIKNINYQWLARKDKPTQVVVNYTNPAGVDPVTGFSSWVPDTVKIPPDPLSAGTEQRLTTFNCEAIKSKALATSAASYYYNLSKVCAFQPNFDSSPVGILLYRGLKVHINTNEGLDADHLITNLQEHEDGTWSAYARVYDASMYVTHAAPGGNPIGTKPEDPFAIADLCDVSQYSASYPGFFQLSWRRPRITLPETLYDASHWSTTNCANVTLSRINDGINNVLAFDWSPAADSTVTLDLGFGNEKAFIRCRVVRMNTHFDAVPAFQWSDDGSSWSSSLGVDYFEPFWSGPDIVGYTFEWANDTTPHRYWRMHKNGPFSSGDSFAEVQFIAWDGEKLFNAIRNTLIYAKNGPGKVTTLDPLVKSWPGSAPIPGSAGTQNLDLSAYTYAPGDGNEYLNIMLVEQCISGNSTGRQYWNGGPGRIMQGTQTAFGQVPASGDDRLVLNGHGVFALQNGGGGVGFSIEQPTSPPDGVTTIFLFLGGPPRSADDRIVVDGAVVYAGTGGTDPYYIADGGGGFTFYNITPLNTLELWREKDLVTIEQSMPPADGVTTTFSFPGGPLSPMSRVFVDGAVVYLGSSGTDPYFTNTGSSITFHNITPLSEVELWRHTSELYIEQPTSPPDGATLVFTFPLGSFGPDDHLNVDGVFVVRSGSGAYPRFTETGGVATVVNVTPMTKLECWRINGASPTAASFLVSINGDTTPNQNLYVDTPNLSIYNDGVGGHRFTVHGAVDVRATPPGTPQSVPDSTETVVTACTLVLGGAGLWEFGAECFSSGFSAGTFLLKMKIDAGDMAGNLVTISPTASTPDLYLSVFGGTFNAVGGETITVRITQTSGGSMDFDATMWAVYLGA